METLWYFLLAGMFTTYVVLDGFDFGVGILHKWVAHTDEERRQVFAAIGPLWDGNEVWLIAGGGTLVFAFPRAYASGFSGFYLALMLVLWLLILRGISIEFRSRETNHLWRSFWDFTFAVSSAVAAIVFGAALGNVIRGVPIDESGYFRGPLFTNFLPGRFPGALDWYTVAVGVMALLVLGAHGALYLSWKTSGVLQERCQRLAPKLWTAVAVWLVVVTVLTAYVQPALPASLLARPWTWVFPPLILASLVAVFLLHGRRRELPAFLASVTFIVSLLVATAAALFPVLLRSTLGPQFDVTAFNATAGRAGLTVGLRWWIPALILAALYFAFLFRSFRGKVHPGEGH